MSQINGWNWGGLTEVKREGLVVYVGALVLKLSSMTGVKAGGGQSSVLANMKEAYLTIFSWCPIYFSTE